MTELIAPPPDEPPLFQSFLVIVGRMDLTQNEFLQALNTATQQQAPVVITEPTPCGDVASRPIQVVFPNPPVTLHFPD